MSTATPELPKTGEEARAQLAELTRTFPGYLPILDELLPLDQCDDWFVFNNGHQSWDVSSGYYRRRRSDGLMGFIGTHERHFKGLNCKGWDLPQGHSRLPPTKAFAAAINAHPSWNLSIADDIPGLDLGMEGTRFHVKAFNRTRFLWLLAANNKRFEADRQCSISRGNVSLCLANDMSHNRIIIATGHNSSIVMEPEEVPRLCDDLTLFNEFARRDSIKRLNDFGCTHEIVRCALNG